MQDRPEHNQHEEEMDAYSSWIRWVENWGQGEGRILYYFALVYE